MIVSIVSFINNETEIIINDPLPNQKKKQKNEKLFCIVAMTDEYMSGQKFDDFMYLYNENERTFL